MDSTVWNMAFLDLLKVTDYYNPVTRHLLFSNHGLNLEHRRKLALNRSKLCKAF